MATRTRRRIRNTWWRRLLRGTKAVLQYLWRGICWVFSKLWRVICWIGRMLRGSLKWMLIVALIAGVIWVILLLTGNGNLVTDLLPTPTPGIIQTATPAPVATSTPAAWQFATATPAPTPTAVPATVPTQPPVVSTGVAQASTWNETQTRVGTGNTGIVQASTIYLRKEASTNSEKVKTLDSCDAVTILQETGEWFYVRDAEGSVGYVKKCFIQRNSNEWIVLSGLTNIYSYPAYTSPSQEGALINQRPAGETYAILTEISNEYGEWYKIRFELGVGFIKKAEGGFYTSSQIDYYYSLERETVEISEETTVWMQPGKVRAMTVPVGTQVQVIDGQNVNGYLMVIIRVNENGAVDTIGFISENDIGRG